ncbi:Dfp1/Him1, central region-domain-containing protein [Pisolithus marmoratus]|nr:Dfp1/Him1, central region-domain-containing protein [Pisolithus marmoratus]
MASHARRPLSARQQELASGHSPQKLPGRPLPPVKRARSPETSVDTVLTQANPKRVKAINADSPTLATPNNKERRDKEQRKLLREATKNEFRVKYTRAFPSFVFYFDLDQLDSQSSAFRSSLAARVTFLGARVDDFFSNEITHLITDEVVPATDDTSCNKENAHSTKGPGRSALWLKSPIKLRGRNADESCAQHFSLVEKAQAFGMKIWNSAKLNSVLERCDLPAPATLKQTPSVQSPPIASTANQRSLTRLLASERLHGTTERDPTQKRHDFRYFSKSSCFVIVEDVRQELATVHALEYPITKGRDGKERGAWPVLYCHPHARGPFIEFDDRERRRWEKSRRAEEGREYERQQKVARELQQKKRAEACLASRRAGDLRRSVSMNNLHRQVTTGCAEEFVDLDADIPDTQPSANASGYLASTCTGTYVAASGNSVAVASTTGTTSTIGSALRTLDLPAHLRGRIQLQIVTSRKASSVSVKGAQNRKPAVMGPPDVIPDRTLLRKSRSTNTLRLPKRDEGTKPGYCESCRVKFDDFEYHIRDRKHRKFAEDDSNYLQLDFLLDRVKRRTRQHSDEERQPFTEYQVHSTRPDERSSSSTGCPQTLEHTAVLDYENEAEGETMDLS